MDSLEFLYKVVFDKNGEVRACGRENCKKLSKACMELHPDVDFGNPDTGMMNIENIKKYFA